jgi:26S proteasome regulatory subunit N11
VKPSHQTCGGNIVEGISQHSNLFHAITNPTLSSTSNIGNQNKPIIYKLIHGLNWHYYSIVIDYPKDNLEEQIIMKQSNYRQSVYGCGRVW